MPDDKPDRWASEEMDYHLLGRRSSLRYRRLNTVEVVEAFGRCEAQPSMRSITAVLRITREQIRSRGQQGGFARFALGAIVVVAMVIIADKYGPLGIQHPVLTAAIGLVAIGLLFLFGVVGSAGQRLDTQAEEEEIKRLAIHAIDRIWRHPFRRKPLQREHIDTLQDLAKMAPHNETLRDILANN